MSLSCFCRFSQVRQLRNLVLNDHFKDVCKVLQQRDSVSPWSKGQVCLLFITKGQGTQVQGSFFTAQHTPCPGIILSSSRFSAEIRAWGTENSDKLATVVAEPYKVLCLWCRCWCLLPASMKLCQVNLVVCRLKSHIFAILVFKFH